MCYWKSSRVKPGSWFYSESFIWEDSKDRKIRNRLLVVIDHITLMVIDKTIENIEQEINKLRFGIVQILCLEKLSEEAAN